MTRVTFISLFLAVCAFSSPAMAHDHVHEPAVNDVYHVAKYLLDNAQYEVEPVHYRSYRYKRYRRSRYRHRYHHHGSRYSRYGHRHGYRYSGHRHYRNRYY